jgi:hypothetical protein
LERIVLQTMLVIELNACQERVVRRLVGWLEEAAACYQFVGGFAGNLHGSPWPLHDLDVDVAKHDLPRLAALLEPYTYHPLGHYEDEEFRLHFLRAKVEGVEIDVSQAEEAYGRRDGKWVPLGVDLARRERVTVLGLNVWVQPLDDLIAYKELIGRQADVAELKSLQHRPRR